MKIRTKIIKLALAALFAVMALSPSVFAQQPAPAPLKQLNWESTQGDVRVVLLRAGQVVSTNGQNQFIVTYAREFLSPDASSGDAFFPLHNIFGTKLNLAVHGKPVEIYNISDRIMYHLDEFQRETGLLKPKTTKGKPILFENIVCGDLKIDAQKIDMTIQFDWREKPMKFDFKNVPLN